MNNIELEHVKTNSNYDFKEIYDSYAYNVEESRHNCQYYEISEMYKKFQEIESDHFTTLSLNIRSLPGKFLEFKNFLDSINFSKFKPAVICLQEIWNKPQYESFLLENYHDFQFKIRDKTGINSNQGGGVGLWIHNSFSFEPLPSISYFIPHVFESQFFKIKTGKNTFVIFGNLYRPNTAPLADIKRSIQILNEIFMNIKSDPNLKHAQDIIIAGDTNIDLLKHENHLDTNMYLDSLLSNGLLPLITLPTRISGHSATLLDHICTNIIDDTFDTGIIISDLSDHFPVFYIRYLQTKPKKPEPIKINKIDDSSKDAFTSLLNSYSWNNVIQDNNPETAFDSFFNTINSCFDLAFPEKVVNQSKNKKPLNPWMSEALLVSRKNKEKLFSKKVKKPNVSNIIKFKDYNKVYTSLVRAARKKYYGDKFEKYSKDCRNTWKIINSVLGKSKHKSDIPNTFISNGHILSGSFEIAEGFNNFFANIGPELSKKIPNSSNSFKDYLSGELQENFIFANMTHDIIFEAAKRLKNKNSAGPDRLSSHILKHILPSIISPICHLFDLSFKSGFIPEILKTAKIVPIFKSGAVDSFTNYRPISLLSPIGKLLEKVAALQMIKFLNKFQILYEHQYGFRANHNTSHPLIHFIDKVFNALNSPDPSYSMGIFIDLKKAFDTCDTGILLSKLEHYGFRGKSNEWFKNYLTGRQQFTCIKGIKSNKREMTCGVPQGSILGPLLFILLINDLPNASSFFTLIFADDTLLQFSGTDLHKLYNLANSELNKISDWFKANKLTLNASKTKYILFRDKSTLVDFKQHDLKIENTSIERIGTSCKEKYFKYVGIRIDEFLTWEFHKKYVKGKLSSAVFALAQTRNLLSSKIKLTIYNSLFRSHLEYCIHTWGLSGGKELKGIEILQKKAMRYIENTHSRAHTNVLFYKYKTLMVKDLIDYNICNFMQKCTHNTAPSSFQNLFIKNRNFDRSLSYNLKLVRKTSLRLFPTLVFPRVWNALTLESKRSESLALFKKKILSDNLEKYNVPCSIQSCKSCS
jgi:hypothetical protein